MAGRIIKAYHFTRGDLLRNGHQIPPIGEWLFVTGEIRICAWGLHASRHVADALTYAPGTNLHLVELEWDIREDFDKLVARRRRILASFEATELLNTVAYDMASDTCDVWGANPTVRTFLKTRDESLRETARMSVTRTSVLRCRTVTARLAVDVAYHAVMGGNPRVRLHDCLVAAERFNERFYAKWRRVLASRVTKEFNKILRTS